MSSKPISILITGANRGLGLEMVKQMLETQPLGLLFAGCRDPDGPKAEGEMDVHETVEGMLCVMNSVTEKHSGTGKARPSPGRCNTN